MDDAASDEEGLAGRQIDILSVNPPGRVTGQPVYRFIPTIVIMGDRHARQLALGMDEALLLHGSATKPKQRRIHPKALFLIAQTIRELVDISAKLGPRRSKLKPTARSKLSTSRTRLRFPR